MLDGTKLEALRNEFGADVQSFEALGFDFALRPPLPVEYKRFRAESLDPGPKRALAVETLLRSCAVFPERSELERILGRYPALADVLGAEALKLAGAFAEVTAGKA